MQFKKLKQPEVYATLPQFTMNWPRLFKPEFNRLKKEWQFSMEAMFPKGEALKELKAKLEKHAKDVWPDADDREELDPFSKIRDQKDKRKENPETKAKYLPEPYVAGNLYIQLTASSKDPTGIVLKEGERYHNQPVIVDGKREAIEDPSSIYSGCLCQAFVKIHAYDYAGNKGITLILQGVQKRADGSPLSGGSRKNADDMFTAIEDADDSDEMFSKV